MSDIINAFLKIMNDKPENMFEAAKRKCPKCGKLLAECICSAVKEAKEGSEKDKKQDKAGEKKYGMTHKEWEKSSMDKKEDAKESFNIDEAKTAYELYHDTYSGAVQHALDHHQATKNITVSSNDHWHHIGSGPRKPSAGETVVHNVPAQDHNGNHHMVHMQVYNRGGDKKPYELNTYSSKIPLKKTNESIEIKPSHKGLFTKKAHAAGESVSKYAEQEKFAGGKLGKEANFALNAKKWHHEETQTDNEEAIDEMKHKTTSHRYADFMKKKKFNDYVSTGKMEPEKKDKKISLTKEEFEHIDELTNKTLKSYIKIEERNKENKAKKDVIVNPKKRPEKENDFDFRNFRKLRKEDADFTDEELAHFAAIMNKGNE